MMAAPSVRTMIISGAKPPLPANRSRHVPNRHVAVTGPPGAYPAGNKPQDIGVNANNGKTQIMAASARSSSSSSIWQQLQLMSGLPGSNPIVPVLVIQIAAGDKHCLLLTNAGNVWGLGSNRHGQIGGQSVQQQQHAGHSARQGTAAQAVPVTRQETMHDSGMQTSSNSVQQPLLVLGLDSNSSCQEEVAQVAAGACHSAALTKNTGRLYTCGWNAHGQCGTGSTADALEPTLCTALDGVPLACVAAGLAHTAVASREGDVYACGWNSNGQLGLAATSADDIAANAEAQGQQTERWQQQLVAMNALWPVLIEQPQLNQEHVVQVTCGSRHTVVLTATGNVYAWGANKYGQCCTNTRQQQLQLAVSKAGASSKGLVMQGIGSAGNDISLIMGQACGLAGSSAAAATAGQQENMAAPGALSIGPASAPEDVLAPQLVQLPKTIATQPRPQPCSGIAKQEQLNSDGAEEAGGFQRNVTGDCCHTTQRLQAVKVVAGRWHTCIECTVTTS